MTASDAPRQMISLDTGKTIVNELQVADSFWSRFVGLQFRRELPAGHGLLLLPCRSIHTCWMRFAIDVIFLDTDFTVLHVCTSIAPWRTAASKHHRPYATLEVAAETSHVLIGERLQVVCREAGAKDSARPARSTRTTTANHQERIIRVSN